MLTCSLAKTELLVDRGRVDQVASVQRGADHAVEARAEAIEELLFELRLPRQAEDKHGEEALRQAHTPRPGKRSTSAHARDSRGQGAGGGGGGGGGGGVWVAGSAHLREVDADVEVIIGLGSQVEMGGVRTQGLPVGVAVELRHLQL